MMYILDKTLKIVRVLNNELPGAKLYWNDTHVEELNEGVNTYEFTCQLDIQEVETDNYVAIKDIDNNLQLFVVIETFETNEAGSYSTRVICEHAGKTELFEDVVRPTTYTNVTPSDYFSQLLILSDWKLKDCDYKPQQTIKIEKHMTLAEAVYLGLKTFGMDIRYSVNFKGGRITSKNVNILNQRGSKTGKIFNTEKDLIKVIREVDTSNVVTALIPSPPKDEQGNILSIVGLSYVGTDVKKTTDADFVYSESAYQNFNRNGKHRFGIFNSESAESNTELLTDTINALYTRSKPSVKYECEAVALEKVFGYRHEKVRLGDTVTCRDDGFSPPLILQTRILRVERSYTEPSRDKIVFGNYKTIDISSEIVDKVVSVASDVYENKQKTDAVVESFTPTSSTIETEKNLDLAGKNILNAFLINTYRIGMKDANGLHYWGAIPIVSNTDGVMEIGKYIDFHEVKQGTEDYSLRLESRSGMLFSSGSINAAGVNLTSSAKIKTNIVPARDIGIPLLKDVNVYEYVLQQDIDNGIYDKHRVGFILESIPSLLRDEEGVDLYTVVGSLWKACQEQQARIESLEKRITDLEEVY